MLSISVVLRLAGWKGVRGGLSQLIYHIKYHPSSAFSLPLFPLSFTHLSSHFSPPHSFFSPPFSIYISHLSSLFLSLLFPFYFLSFMPSQVSLKALEHFTKGSFFKRLPYAYAPYTSLIPMSLSFSFAHFSPLRPPLPLSPPHIMSYLRQFVEDE